MADDILLREQIFGFRGMPVLGHATYSTFVFVVITPVCRILEVASENRTMVVASENRTLAILTCEDDI